MRHPPKVVVIALSEAMQHCLVSEKAQSIMRQLYRNQAWSLWNNEESRCERIVRLFWTRFIKPKYLSVTTYQKSFADRAEQINHDMRTPIGTLATALELLSGTFGEDDSVAETLSVMNRQIARLTALSDELRKLAVELTQHK